MDQIGPGRDEEVQEISKTARRRSNRRKSHQKQKEPQAETLEFTVFFVKRQSNEAKVCPGQFHDRRGLDLKAISVRLDSSCIDAVINDW